jgi:hypothetical protein
MNLEEIRQKIPEYSDLSDQQIADSLYQKHYSDMDRAEFDNSIGLAPVNDARKVEPQRPEGPITPLIEGAEYVAGMGQQVMNTLMMSGADEVAAGLETGAGLWGDYGETLNRLRGQDQETRERWPISSSVAQAAGAVLPAVMLRAPPAFLAAQTGGRLTRGLKNTAVTALAGASGGTVEGFLGSPEGSRVEGAFEGAKWGAGLGALFPGGVAAISKLGELGASAVGKIKRLVGGDASFESVDAPQEVVDGLKQLLQALNDDQISPEDFMTSLDNISPLASPADLGMNTRQLARSVGQQPGTPYAQAAAFYGDRRLGTTQRVKDDMMEGMTGGDPKMYEVIGELDRTRKTEAAPLYDEAYDRPPLLMETVIDATVEGNSARVTLAKLFERPSMTAAMGRAVSIAREEGRDPSTMGFIFDNNGDPIGIRTPSWQTLDYVRRGLDDGLNELRDSVTLRLNLNESGRALVQTRTDFNNALRANNTAYASALDAWAGPSRAMDYITNGRLFLRGDPEAVAQRFEDMSPVDQEYFRLGAAQELKVRIEKRIDGSDPYNSLWGSDDMKARLATVFPDEAALAQFVRTVESEHTMIQTANSVNPTVGSQTNTGSLSQNLLTGPRAEGIASAAMALLRGNPTGVVGGVVRAAAPEYAARTAQLRAESLAPYMFTNSREKLGRLSNMLINRGDATRSGGGALQSVLDSQLQGRLAQRLAAMNAGQSGTSGGITVTFPNAEE